MSDNGATGLTAEQYFATNGERVAANFRKEAEAQLIHLQDTVEETLKALRRHKEGAFDAWWGKMMSDRLSAFQNEIARGNGAVLVRSTITTEAP